MHETREVAGAMQFCAQPGITDSICQIRQRGRWLLALQRRHNALCGQHAALHGCVITLDLDAIQGACITSHQHAAGKGHVGERVLPALGQRARAVCNALSTLEYLAGLRMGFPALELFKRTEVWIAVVQIGDQAEIDLVVFSVVQEGAAAGVGFRQRPANAVHNQPFLVFVGVDFPDFFNADAVMLGVFTLIEVKMRDQLFAEMATTAFGEHRVPRVQFHAGYVAIFLSAVCANTHFAGRNAFNATCVIKQHLCCRKAGVDLDAHALGLLGQPATDVTH